MLTLLMFELGLTLDMRGFGLLLQRPAPVIAGLLGQVVLLPLLAFALGWLFELDAVFFLGLVLIACSPGGSSSNVFTMVAQGNLPLSILLTGLSSIITLFTIPVVMQFALHLAGDGGVQAIHLPIGRLLVQNLLLVLLPVAIGVMVRWRYPTLALRMHGVLSKIALPALILLASLFFIQHHETIAAQFGRLGACVIMLILAATSGGWLLARIVGVNRVDRRTLVIEIGMQNAAQAIAIAVSPFVFACEAMAIPAIVYALMMNVILLAYVGLLRRSRHFSGK